MSTRDALPHGLFGAIMIMLSFILLKTTTFSGEKMLQSSQQIGILKLRLSNLDIQF